MLTADFDYHLPAELIASEPLPDRAASRMMVVHRRTGLIEHRAFGDFSGYLGGGDLVVLNDTRVVPARFFTDEGGREVLRLETVSALRWRCMVRPGKKFRLNQSLHIGGARGTVVDILENGERVIQFDRPVDETAHGHLALPHYMGREDQPADRERYQTVFGRHEGSIAAPTAGLHFTPELLQRIDHAFVTLHVGVGTFQPVKSAEVAGHLMHAERYTVPQATVDAVARSTRIIAVGTTATRTLESVARDHEGKIVACAGSTDIFIYPGYRFAVVGALLTNFHLPKSTLIMLVSAFASRELILRAYAEAIQHRYRFYSYGDCMLIL